MLTSLQAIAEKSKRLNTGASISEEFGAEKIARRDLGGGGGVICISYHNHPDKHSVRATDAERRVCERGDVK
jgi:hypothetical protein